jgi:hypothetical protein
MRFIFILHGADRHCSSSKKHITSSGDVVYSVMLILIALILEVVIVV